MEQPRPPTNRKPQRTPLHFGSVYSTLILDQLKPGKFQHTVKNTADSRCPCGYVHIANREHASALGRHITHILREASARLLVLRYGQFQGLSCKNELTVRLSRFFFYIHISPLPYCRESTRCLHLKCKLPNHHLPLHAPEGRRPCCASLTRGAA